MEKRTFAEWMALLIEAEEIARTMERYTGGDFETYRATAIKKLLAGEL